MKEDILERVIISDEEKFYKALVQTPKSEDEDSQDEYAVMYLTKEHEYILGTLVQSYTKLLTKFDENYNDKKEVKLKDSKINDKTLFYINSIEGILYIQSKRFPEYLTEGVMRLRMQDILSKCFGYKVQILPTEINYSLEQVEEIFMTSSVKSIAFRNLNGLELPKLQTWGTPPLHNRGFLPHTSGSPLSRPSCRKTPALPLGFQTPCTLPGHPDLPASTLPCIPSLAPPSCGDVATFTTSADVPLLPCPPRKNHRAAGPTNILLETYHKELKKELSKHGIEI